MGVIGQERLDEIKHSAKEWALENVPDPSEVPAFAKTLVGTTCCCCCLGIVFLVMCANTLSLTIEGEYEVWQMADCEVLGPGRVTTLPAQCTEFSEDTTCTGYAEYQNVIASIFVRYCRAAADGGKCFDVQADKCGFDSPVDFMQDESYTNLTTDDSGSGIIKTPCWYNRASGATEEAVDNEAVSSACESASSASCRFFKTSKAVYSVRLDESPCVQPPPKGSRGLTIAMGVLSFLSFVAMCFLAWRARYELLEDEDEFVAAS
mmetsp:Transcript_65351/g.115961  ORF Transcript_65351/g.115961 Transcript_65351/m.115961 type:complete len:263 (-) Transcript_65351:108-896(-)